MTPEVSLIRPGVLASAMILEAKFERFAALATIDELAPSENFLSLLKITLLPSMLKSRVFLLVSLPSALRDLTYKLLGSTPPWSSNKT